METNRISSFEETFSHFIEFRGGPREENTLTLPLIVAQRTNIFLISFFHGYKFNSVKKIYNNN